MEAPGNFPLHGVDNLPLPALIPARNDIPHPRMESLVAIAAAAASMNSLAESDHSPYLPNTIGAASPQCASICSGRAWYFPLRSSAHRCGEHGPGTVAARGPPGALPLARDGCSSGSRTVNLSTITSFLLASRWFVGTSPETMSDCPGSGKKLRFKLQAASNGPSWAVIRPSQTAIFCRADPRSYQKARLSLAVVTQTIVKV